METAAWILRKLCKPPANGNGDPYVLVRTGVSEMIQHFRRDFGPGFETVLAGARVLDVGCGTGEEAVALSRLGAGRTYAIDMRREMMQLATEQLPGNSTIILVQGDATRLPFRSDTFDVAISRNSMEHFQDPAAILAEIQRVLRPRGRFFVTFGPPWYGPYGAHMQFMTDVPWIQVLFSEWTLMAQRRSYRSDGAQRFVEVEGGLNQMSVAKFERLVAVSGLRPLNVTLRPVRGLTALTRVPGLRELFTQSISCVLTK